MSRRPTDPKSPTIDVRVRLGEAVHALQLETAPTLFSPRRADPGSLAMLSQLAWPPPERETPLRILDLGCGYGLVGLVLATALPTAEVLMTDVDPVAVACARRNAERLGLGQVQVQRSDGFDDIAARDFDLILSNPPYHTDFAIASRFIQGAWRHLRLGGQLYMVTKRREWYRRRITAVFGGLSLRLVDGYCVFVSDKRPRPPRD